LWELSQDKYEPLWLKGGNHCDLELFPEYIKHLKKFVSMMEKPPSQRHSSRSNTDVPENSRKSTDGSEGPRKSTDRREKPRKSTDQREKPRKSTDRPERLLRIHEYRASSINKLEKLDIPFDQLEKSRRSIEYHEKSQKSIDLQFEKGRRSVDWVDRIRVS